MNGLRSLGLCLLLLAALGRPATAQYRAEAIPGTPLGAGKIEVRLPAGRYSPVLGVEGLVSSERNDRVL